MTMEMPTDGGGGEASSGLPLEQRVVRLEQEVAAMRAYLQGSRTAQMPATPPPHPPVSALAPVQQRQRLRLRCRRGVGANCYSCAGGKPNQGGQSLEKPVKRKGAGAR